MEEWQEIHAMITKALAHSPTGEHRGELQPGQLTNGPLLFRIHNYLQKQLQIYKEQNGETPGER
jgi:hypothetical protein